jgi:hypothetical protein
MPRRRSRWGWFIPRIDRLRNSLLRLRRYIVYRHFDKRCVYCGALCSFKETTLDHVHALGKGGSDTYDNLAVACRPCNGLKWKLSIHQFRNATIGKQRQFFFESNIPIDVPNARRWIRLSQWAHREQFLDNQRMLSILERQD